MTSCYDKLYDRMDRMLAAQDRRDPYLFDGVSYAPVVLSRAMRTDADVARVIRQTCVIRKKSIDKVAAECGIELRVAKRLITEGRGSYEDLMSVLGCLGVRPVALPPSFLEV